MYFWGNVFDYFRERRLAGMFFAILMGLGGLLVVGVLICRLLGDNVVYLLPPGLFSFLFWAGRAILRARARWQARYESSPLSDDDLKKARTRLRARR
jgi:hypothetical protein